MRDMFLFSRVAALVAVLALQACGGSGGGGSSEPPVTPVPDTLSVSTTGTVEAGVAQAFSSSATAAPGLRFEWSFGDGTTSSDAAPTHAYPLADEYAVTLRISNAAGQSRQASAAVTVNRLVHLQGLRCTGANQTGWCRTLPAQFGDDATDVNFVDETHGWAVGFLGAVRHTSDGGRTWQEQTLGTTTSLSAVRFRDRLRGWISTATTRDTFRTVDAGTTWEKVPTPPAVAPTFKSMDLLDNGTLLQTWRRGSAMPFDTDYFSTDGGTTWTASAISTPFRSPLGTLWVNNSNSAQQTGILRSTNLGASFERVLQTRRLPRSTLTVFDEQSVLVRYPNGDPLSPDPVERLPHAALTRDGGTTWNRFNPVGLAAPSVDFPPSPVAWDDSGWLVIQEVRDETHGPSQASRDHGRTWQPLTRPRSAASGQEDCLIRPVQGPVVACIDGYVSSTRQMWLSTDRGSTWTEAAVPNPAGQFGEFQRLAADTLLAQVYSPFGTVWWISRDLGRIWKKLLPANDTPRFVSGHWALSPQVILRAGSNGGADATVDRSSDGGRTWQRIDLLGVQGAAFQFVSDRVGWLAGSRSLHRTTDGGQTWTQLPAPPVEEVPWFRDEQNGYLVNFNGLRVTDDGGATWRSAETPGAPTPAAQRCVGSRARFFNSSDGIVLTYSNDPPLLITRDGGRTCTPKALPALQGPISSIAMVGDRTVWVLSEFTGGVAKSSDRGETWEPLTTASALPAGVFWSTVFFLDANNGWLGATGGYAAVTRDGGRTWQAQRSPLEGRVAQIQFVDARTGWVLGGGMVFGTGTGGN